MRAKPDAPADRPPDEAEAILHDVEGPTAPHELRALKSIGNKPGEVTLYAQLQGLAKFAPIFSAPDFQFGVWQYPPPEPSGIINLPYCELSDGAGAFVQAAYDLGWVKIFDWSAWMTTPEGKELVSNPERIATATPAQLAMLLTFYIRADRFNEGFLNSAFESGVLTAIVLRKLFCVRASLDCLPERSKHQ